MRTQSFWTTLSVNQKLLDSVPAAGSVIVYSASYESTRLKELAEDFPEYSEQLTNIRDRLVDLKVVIQKGVFYPEFMGSFSIKKVAPALLRTVSINQITWVVVSPSM